MLIKSLYKQGKNKKNGMVQQSVKKWQKSTIFCRGLIYQAQFFEPCQKNQNLLL